MTGPSQHEPLDEQERELARILRALPGAEPSAAVDQRILRAAADAAASTRRPVRRWLAMGSAGWGIGGAAAAVLALGVGWHLLDPAREATFQASAPAPAAQSRDEAVTVTLGEPQANAFAPPAAQKAAPPPPARPRMATVPRRPPASVAAAPVVAAPVEAAPAADAAAMAAPAAVPMDAVSAEASARLADQQSQRQSEAAGDLARRQEDAAASAGMLAAPQAKSSSAEPAARAGAMTPIAWIAQVRDLRDAHREAEAAASLRRFHQFYPQYAIPADLLPLLRD